MKTRFAKAITLVAIVVGTVFLTRACIEFERVDRCLDLGGMMRGRDCDYGPDGPAGGWETSKRVDRAIAHSAVASIREDELRGRAATVDSQE